MWRKVGTVCGVLVLVCVASSTVDAQKNASDVNATTVEPVLDTNVTDAVENDGDLTDEVDGPQEEIPPPEELLKINKTCMWSDEVGCFLDYFDILPESEIKEFYRKDEDCAKKKAARKCRRKPECVWENLACYARVSNKELNACAKNGFPEPGTMCSVFKSQDVCRTKGGEDKTQCKQAGCDWDLIRKNCVPSRAAIVALEFAKHPTSGSKIWNLQQRCLAHRKREACEDPLNRLVS